MRLKSLLVPVVRILYQSLRIDPTITKKSNYQEGLKAGIRPALRACRLIDITVSDDHPVRNLRRIAVVKRLERIDLSLYSRQIQRNAVWCGCVSALALILTALNFTPPVDVQYRVTGRATVEANRVLGLLANLKQSIEGSGTVRLRDFKVLDRASHEQQPRIALADQNLMLISVDSLWSKSCTQSQFQDWVESITRLPENQLASVGATDATRVAKWELAAAKHYENHHEFLSAEEDAIKVSQSNRAEPSEGTFQLASSKQTIPAQLTSSTQGQQADLGVPTDIRQQLLEGVDRAQSKVHQSEIAQKASLERILGTISIPDLPDVQPIPSPIPIYLAVSVLIVGLAGGASAGWIQLRLQSGGAYDPEEIAALLASRDLPVVGKVELSGDQLESSDWLEMATQQASATGRTAARNLTLISETVIGFWCILICVRAAFDTHWLSLFLESPLGALGRLLSGLP